MVTLRRLLELAGLLEDLPPVHDNLPVETAKRLFASEGEPVDLTDTGSLHRAWLRLQRKYHEVGTTPDSERLARINRAYDVIKRATGEPMISRAASDEQPAESAQTTVWAWDGRLFTKGMTVKVTPSSYDRLAEIAATKMRRGFALPKAILLQYHRKMVVIYSNGRYMHPPPDYPVFGDPGQDRQLAAWLRQL